MTPFIANVRELAGKAKGGKVRIRTVSLDMGGNHETDASIEYGDAEVRRAHFGGGRVRTKTSAADQANFYAACSPDFILALLDVADAAEAYTRHTKLDYSNGWSEEVSKLQDNLDKALSRLKAFRKDTP